MTFGNNSIASGLLTNTPAVWAEFSTPTFGYYGDANLSQSIDYIAQLLTGAQLTGEHEFIFDYENNSIWIDDVEYDILEGHSNPWGGTEFILSLPTLITYNT